MRAFIETAKHQLAPLYTPNEISRIARLLLEKWAGVDAVSYYADKDRKIPPSVSATLQKALDRLERHEPLEYVLGTAEFAGIRLQVDNRVLIPRPETEELVGWILDDHQKQGTTPPKRLLDVCTGSGCIAIALAKAWPETHTEGWDVSEQALQVASLNATENKTDILFRQVDVLSENLFMDEAGTFDLIVSNPPYVLRSESSHMAPNVLDFEPHLALFVEDDNPLLFYKALANLGKTALIPGGSLYMEINGELGRQTKELFEQEGYSATMLKKDLYGKDRFVKATR